MNTQLPHPMGRGGGSRAVSSSRSWRDTMVRHSPSQVPSANPPTGFGPEAELILCCAGTRLDGTRTERIRTLLRGDLDWARLLRAAQLQKVAPLLHTNLNAIAPDAVPETVLTPLRQYFHANARRNLARSAELVRLLALFSAKNIPAIPFKGPCLAVSAYGSLALREFADLDILVPEREVARASALLLSCGYRPDTYEPEWEFHFVDRGRGVTIDLHQRTASRYFPPAEAFEKLWERLEPVSLGGAEARTLAAEDLLLVLSVHLAKDCREWKERLSQVCDVAELICARPELSWDRVLRRAQATGGRRILLLSLYLARDLLGAELPEPVARAARADPAVAALAAQVSGRLLKQAAGSVEFLPYRERIWREDSVFHLRIRERLGDKAQYVRLFLQNHVHLLLTPTEKDRNFVALPRRLAFLYYLVRPMRVLGERARLWNGPPSPDDSPLVPVRRPGPGP